MTDSEAVADVPWTGILAMLNSTTLDGRMVPMRAPYRPPAKTLPLYYAPAVHGPSPVLAGSITRTWIDDPPNSVPLWLYASGTALRSSPLATALLSGASPIIHVDFTDAAVYARQTIYGVPVVVPENWQVASATAYSAGWPNFIQARILIDTAALPKLATPKNVGPSGNPKNTSFTAKWDKVTDADTYTATATPGGATVTTDKTQADFTRMTPATAYTIAVTASDSTGMHRPSDPGTGKITTPK